MNNYILGVVGHINHGKTTLISKLIDKNLDTLPEEQKRNITIEMGVGEINFSDKNRYSIIDMPGHKKYIKNMCVGANSVDFIILVIACDDGIMPQTIEHFNIVRFLGIEYGTIVFTKRELVDEKRYKDLLSECKEQFRGSFLDIEKNFPLLSNDENLKNLLEKKLKKLPQKINVKDSRYEVDRVFSKNGVGSIVTGVIKSGEINLKDEFRIYPSMIDFRVKGIENHNKKYEKLSFGKRCAIAVGSIPVEYLKNSIIVKKNSLMSTKIIGCRFISITGDNRELKYLEKIKLNIGALEITGKVIFIKKDYIQLELEKEVFLNHNDRGIVRKINPSITVGGVIVLDIYSQKLKKDSINEKTNMEILDSNDRYIVVENIIKIFFRFQEKNFLKEYTNYVELDEILKKLIIENKIYLIGDKYIHYDNLQSLILEIKDFFSRYYSNNPLKKYVEKPIFKEYFFKNIDNSNFNAILEHLKKIDVIDECENKISLFGYKISLSKEDKNLKEIIFKLYKEMRFSLVEYSKLKLQYKNIDRFEKLHRYMVDEEFIIYLGDEKYILKGYLSESKKILKEYLEKNKEIDLKKGRELLQTNRENIILILNRLEKEKFLKNKDGIRTLK